MYEEYAVASKIELGKTYKWNRSEHERYHGGDVIALEELPDYWVLKYPNETIKDVLIRKHKAVLDNMLHYQTVLVKEFDKG
jgi:hypothetical protein